VSGGRDFDRVNEINRISRDSDAGTCILGLIVAATVFRWSPADPFFKGVGEGEGIIVTDSARDGVDFVRGILQEVRRATHTEVRDLVHRGAAQVLMAQAAKMFRAATGEFGKGLGRPVFVEARIDGFPKLGEAIMGVPRLGEAHGVALDQFGPMLNGDRIGGGVDFVVETLNGGAERAAVEPGENGRGGGDERALVLRLFVADPAETPARAGDTLEGVEDVRRREAGGAGAADSPAAIEQDAALPREAGQEIGAAQVRAHHLVRMRGIRDADVADLVPAQGGAFVGPNDPLMGSGAHGVCFR